MVNSAYQYYDDTSNLWQIQLPQDFAIALNLVPALGSEPYLDPSISPRVATYRCTAPLSVRTAVVGTVTAFGANLPNLLTVAGLNYYLQSAIGETIPPYPTANQVLAQGPQGPPGNFGTVANDVIVGNISGANIVPVGLTQAQATALLNLFSSTLQGLVPASGGGTSSYLRADGTWDTVSGLSAISNDQVLGNISGSSALPIGLTQTQLTALLQIFSSTLSGAVPASGGGSVNFLRADGSWATPSPYPLAYSVINDASNFTITPAGSFVSFLTGTYPAGTYLVNAAVTIYQNGGAGQIVAIQITSTVSIQSNAQTIASQYVNLSITSIVVLATTGAITLTVYAASNTNSEVFANMGIVTVVRIA